MKARIKVRARWKRFSPEEIKQIIDDYNSGILRSKIEREYKMSRAQLNNIIRDFIMHDNAEKEKLEKEKLIVNPKTIPLYTYK